ncbi:hypothetical protein [Rhodoligotrophos defluvii]|uniref:hypothetical protein n=1 Tax=Rhodoligotrophos defluvii TaxID=2561934 RepID=UPI0010C97247|nr:hypothetical protein [Rhodoligotrophos defluvii]
MAEAEYQGHKYVVSGRGRNRWHWAVYKPGGGTPVTAGVVDGANHKADEAARRAIDRLLNKK